MKTKLFTLFLALVASAGITQAAIVDGSCGDNLTWSLNTKDSTLTITGSGKMTNWFLNSAPWYDYKSYIKYVSLPDGLTSFGSGAFYECSGLTSIEIPNSLTSIGDYAFRECSGLTSIEIPNSVTSIGNGAFYQCTGLTSVTIPNSVTSIGYSAFAYCSSLTSVTIPYSVTSIGDNAFSGCSGLPIYDNIRYADTYLIGTVDKTLSSYTIKEGTKWVGSDAFYGCTGLTSIEIPNSVTSIGGGAFYGCSGLTSIEIPNSVTSIGNSAFNGCTGLTSIEIPNSVTSIGGYAFRDCTGLTSIEIPNSVTSLGGSIHSGDSLITFKLPDHLTKEACGGEVASYSIIGYYSPGNDRVEYYVNMNAAFVNNIRNINAPAWFFDIHETFWVYCPKQLEKVVVSNFELTSNALTVIGRSHKTLQSLDLSGVTSTEFADEAVKGCYNMTDLKLPSNVEHIGYMSVAECVKLQSIDIPASVIEIEDRAFENCRSLKTITFGGQAASAPGRFNAPAASASQLQRIGSWAFYNCHELQNLEIPEGVTEIGDGAFYGCTYLEELSLPASVQSIGDNTFALCAKMKRMNVAAIQPPTIEAKTFEDVSRTMPVYVPDESVNLYKADPLWDEMNIVGQHESPTGIDTITDNPSPVTHKIIKDNQILILRGEKVYTVTGQEVK